MTKTTEPVLERMAELKSRISADDWSTICDYVIRARDEQVERDTIRRVVEWLRDVLDPLDADHEGWLATGVADRIEAGEWKGTDHG